MKKLDVFAVPNTLIKPKGKKKVTEKDSLVCRIHNLL